MLFTRLTLIGCFGFLAATTSAGELHFEPLPSFTQLPAYIALGACSAAAVDRRKNIYLYHRGKKPIISLDAKGNYVRSWGDDVIDTAHGMRVDGDGNLWVTDIGQHRVFKFSPKGKLLLQLGTGRAGNGLDEFNKPTDVAFGTDGTFYVSDGYGNSRVMKFTPRGRLITTWGKPGKGRGEFDLPHSILVDPKGRVLVGDRENDRIQVFDGDGMLLHIWEGCAPYGMELGRKGELFVADGRANQILLLDFEGNIKQRFGEKGPRPGQFQLPHMLACDAEGNLIIAEVQGRRFQKLLRKE